MTPRGQSAPWSVAATSTAASESDGLLRPSSRDEEHYVDANHHPRTGYHSSSLWQKIALVTAGVFFGCFVTSWTRNEDLAMRHATTSPPPMYTKFKALGFQIYTGGAPAFLQSDNHDSNGTQSGSSSSSRKQPNPECQTLRSYGHVEGNIQCYLGLLDPSDDVQKRLRIMEQAVERAYALVRHNNNNDNENATDDDDTATLKIFIAPEFFWRGKDGAYVFDNRNQTHKTVTDDNDKECTEVCQVLSALERLVAQARFKDWLFLFGTVIVSEILPVEDTYDYLFYNFAPMYKGYDPATQSHKGKRFIIPKRYVSNIDFLTPRRHFDDSLAKELLQSVGPNYRQSDYATTNDNPEESHVVLNPYNRKQKKYDRDMWYRYKDELNALGYTMIEYDWLILDGITLTVEVCLDHDLKTALNTYLADAVLGSQARIPSSSEYGGLTYVPIPQHQAQISLVSSAGMTVNPDSMALVNGGTIILQDGESADNMNMIWQDECQQYSWHFKGGSEAIRRTAEFSPTEVVFEYHADAAFTKHSIFVDNENSSNNNTSLSSGNAWRRAIEGVFSQEMYEPMITVYSTMDIAKVQR